MIINDNINDDNYNIVKNEINNNQQVNNYD